MTETVRGEQGGTEGELKYLRGAAHPLAKLTAEMVEEIRASTESNRVLADRYGVSHTSIRNVRVGATWKAAAPAG